MTDRCFLMESCLSWSKEHDWKSCNESTLIRGFESLALRHNIFVDKPLIIKGLSTFLRHFTYAVLYSIMLTVATRFFGVFTGIVCVKLLQ